MARATSAIVACSALADDGIGFDWLPPARGEGFES